MAAPSDAAIKTRIITHMNADHAHSLSLYAQHYNRLPPTTAATAKLVDITNEHMIMTTSFGRVMIPFDPPMRSLTESRPRLVAMNEECLHGLNYDPSGISMEGKYILANRLWQQVLTLFCLFLHLTLPFKSQLNPDSGSWLAWVWSLGGLWPGLGRLTYEIGPTYVLPGMIAVHLGEAYFFATTRLRRYQVPVGSSTWWKWMVDCSLDGYGSIGRFDETVASMKAKKDTKQH